MSGKLFSDLSFISSDELSLLVAYLSCSEPRSQRDLLEKFNPELRPNGARGYYAADPEKVWDYLSTRYGVVIRNRRIKSMAQLCMRCLDWAIRNELIEDGGNV